MKLSNVERRDRELVYISDEEVFEEQKITRRLTQELNTVDRSDFAAIKRIVNELLGKSDGEECSLEETRAFIRNWIME